MNWYGFVPNCRFFCPHPLVTDMRAYYATSAEAASAREALVWRPASHRWGAHAALGLAVGLAAIAAHGTSSNGLT